MAGRCDRSATYPGPQHICRDVACNISAACQGAGNRPSVAKRAGCRVAWPRSRHLQATECSRIADARSERHLAEADLRVLSPRVPSMFGEERGRKGCTAFRRVSAAIVIPPISRCPARSIPRVGRAAKFERLCPRSLVRHEIPWAACAATTFRRLLVAVSRVHGRGCRRTDCQGFGSPRRCVPPRRRTDDCGRTRDREWHAHRESRTERQ